MRPNNPPGAGPQPIPTYRINADEVEEAYQAFSAMRRMAMSEPSLVSNKYFTALQDTAFARFLMTYEAL